jgi:hypothetical protein
VPYHWVKIPSSPPQERRNDVRKIVRSHDGRLVSDQTYYDEDGQAFALIEVPEGGAAREAILEELGAEAWVGLIDADEKAEDMVPPPSGEPEES